MSNKSYNWVSIRGLPGSRCHAQKSIIKGYFRRYGQKEWEPTRDHYHNWLELMFSSPLSLKKQREGKVPDFRGGSWKINTQPHSYLPSSAATASHWTNPIGGQRTMEPKKPPTHRRLPGHRACWRRTERGSGGQTEDIHTSSLKLSQHNRFKGRAHC